MANPNNPSGAQVDPSEVDLGGGQSSEQENRDAAEPEGEESEALDEAEASGGVIAE